MLRDIEVGEQSLTETAPRPLAALRPEVVAVNAACAACDYAILGQTVPNLIGELHTLTEVHGSTEARRLAERRAELLEPDDVSLLVRSRACCTSLPRSSLR